MTLKENESDDLRIFVSDTNGPENYVGFFEDDGETGYLYVSDRKQNKIVRHLQIYNSAHDINPREEDIAVLWSADGQKCGVIIFDGTRGIIDLQRNIEGRAKMTGRSSPPITDSDWLEGF